MNDQELKESWESLHDQGLTSRSEDELTEIIRQGASKTKDKMSRKLFRDMAITAGACIVSAIGVVFFYAIYDPAVHTQVDASKLVPIQLLGFVIFSILFLFGWLEYKLVDKTFEANPLRSHLSGLLEGFKRYSTVFMATITLLLFVTFYLELSYFITGNGTLWLWLKLGFSSLLTTLSYWGIRYYYGKTFEPYLKEMSGYLEDQ